MDQLSSLTTAFDYLDIVLAMVGALLVSLWFGRGKSIWTILSGALVGGLAKPAAMLVLFGGVLVATQQGNDSGSGNTALDSKTKAEQDKIIKFWTQKPHVRHN